MIEQLRDSFIMVFIYWVVPFQVLLTTIVVNRLLNRVKALEMMLEEKK